jgi:Xaa-Pro aminopeptidase
MEKEKISQAIKILKKRDIDCWMIIEKESEILSDPVMDFLVGTGVVWLSFFIFFKSGDKYAILGNLDKEKIDRLRLFDEVVPYKNSPRQDLIRILKKHNPLKIALNYSVDSPSADGLTTGKYLWLKEALSGTGFDSRFVSSEDMISDLRGKKSGEEIRRMKKAIDITLGIFDEVTARVKPGFSEKQVAQFITAQREEMGLLPAWEEEQCPSVFTGPQESGAHSGPTDKILQRGHVFNIDFGVMVEKYCSDLQRTWYILNEHETEPPEPVKEGFMTIFNSIQKAFDALKPGVTGFEIDKIARDYIVSRGYDEYPHALGHQVGRSSHDGGALLAPDWERYGKLPFTPLQQDQVFTIEPRLYLKEYGVVTVEEMVLITGNGARWLSEIQKDIFIIR